MGRTQEPRSCKHGLKIPNRNFFFFVKNQQTLNIMAKDQKPSRPKEAQVMEAILKDMGITDYEPGVINQMLEFTYRYVSQILDDARVYANYAKKNKNIEMDDVKLAVHMMME